MNFLIYDSVGLLFVAVHSIPQINALAKDPVLETLEYMNAKDLRQQLISFLQLFHPCLRWKKDHSWGWIFRVYREPRTEEDDKGRV